jgi:ATP-dependent RNA helicase RhlE
MTQAYLPMRRIRWLVLDEADRMLDMGFIDDVDKILRRVPMSRQTMLFSATLPPPILALAQRYMLYPKEFRIDPGTRVPEGIAQVFYRCPHGRKVDMLRAVLKAESPDKALIFTATKVSTSEIARRLRSDGHEVYPISSNLRQADRERVLDGFRQGTIRMLVATDVAARGIDIDDITHVINLELPMEPEDYVHRIGRTGRVERLGRAISFVDSRDEASLRQIEKLLGARFEVGVMPGFEAREGEAHHERGERRGGHGSRGEGSAREGRGRGGHAGGRPRGSGDAGRGGGEPRAARGAHPRAHRDSPKEAPGAAQGGADRAHEGSTPAARVRGGHARDHAPDHGRGAAKKTHEGAPPSSGGRSRGSRGRGRRRRPGGAGGGGSSA